MTAPPPAYPETTLETPFTCLKTASMPQKHPPAKTAAAAPSPCARAPIGPALNKTLTPNRSASVHFVRKSIFGFLTGSASEWKLESRFPGRVLRNPQKIELTWLLLSTSCVKTGFFLSNRQHR